MAACPCVILSLEDEPVSLSPAEQAEFVHDHAELLHAIYNAVDDQAMRSQYAAFFLRWNDGVPASLVLRKWPEVFANQSLVRKRLFDAYRLALLTENWVLEKMKSACAMASVDPEKLVAGFNETAKDPQRTIDPALRKFNEASFAQMPQDDIDALCDRIHTMRSEPETVEVHKVDFKETKVIRDPPKDPTLQYCEHSPQGYPKANICILCAQY